MDLKRHLHDVVAPVGPVGPGTVVHRRRPDVVVSGRRIGSWGPPPACPAGDATVAQLEEEPADTGSWEPSPRRYGTGWFLVQGAVAAAKGAEACGDCWPA